MLPQRQLREVRDGTLTDGSDPRALCRPAATSSGRRAFQTASVGCSANYRTSRAFEYDQRGVEVGRRRGALEAQANSLINLGIDHGQAGHGEKTASAFREVEQISRRDALVPLALPDSPPGRVGWITACARRPRTGRGARATSTGDRDPLLGRISHGLTRCMRTNLCYAAPPRCR